LQKLSGLLFLAHPLYHIYKENFGKSLQPAVCNVIGSLYALYGNMIHRTVVHVLVVITWANLDLPYSSKLFHC